MGKKCKKISATTLSDTNEHIEDIRRFAKAFKMKRLSLGLTQTQIGRALTAGDGPAYSQSAICRWVLKRFFRNFRKSSAIYN